MQNPHAVCPLHNCVGFFSMPAFEYTDNLNEETDKYQVNH